MFGGSLGAVVNPKDILAARGNLKDSGTSPSVRQLPKQAVCLVARVLFSVCSLHNRNQSLSSSKCLQQVFGQHKKVCKAT